jgi:hypothetical protein
MCRIPRWTAGLRLVLFGRGNDYFFVSVCDTHDAETWEATDTFPFRGQNYWQINFKKLQLDNG